MKCLTTLWCCKEKCLNSYQGFYKKPFSRQSSIPNINKFSCAISSLENKTFHILLKEKFDIKKCDFDS